MNTNWLSFIAGVVAGFLLRVLLSFALHLLALLVILVAVVVVLAVLVSMTTSRGE